MIPLSPHPLSRPVADAGACVTLAFTRPSDGTTFSLPLPLRILCLLPSVCTAVNRARSSPDIGAEVVSWLAANAAAPRKVQDVVSGHLVLLPTPADPTALAVTVRVGKTTTVPAAASGLTVSLSACVAWSVPSASPAPTPTSELDPASESDLHAPLSFELLVYPLVSQPKGSPVHARRLSSEWLANLPSVRAMLVLAGADATAAAVSELLVASVDDVTAVVLAVARDVQRWD